MAHAIRRPAVTAGSPVSSTFNWLYNLRPGALAALYAVVSYAVLIALAASALVLASSGIYQQADQRLAASASASAEYVDQRLESRVGLLNFVASRSALIAALSAGTVDQAGLATVQSSLNQLLTATDLGYSAFITWPDGVSVWSTASPSAAGTNYSNLDWYRGLMRSQGVYVSAAYQIPVADRPLGVAEVVRMFDSAGRFIAILGVSFEINKIKAYVDSFAGTQGISLLVADQAGTVVAQSGATATALVKSHYSGVAAALRGQSGNDDTAAQALSAYAPAGWAHWAVVAQVSRSTALSGLYLLQRSVVLIAGTLGLINLGSVVVLQGALRRRSNAEDAHKRTSEYARSLLEASLDPLVTISAEGKITDVNEAAAKVTGVQRATLVGTDFSDYFTEPDKARAGYRRVFAQGSVVDYPLTVCARDGHLTPVLYNASLYRDTEGKVAGVFAAARDVTAQRQASQYARSLLEASLDPLVTISAEGKITDVNEAAAKVTGVQRATLVGTDFSDYFTEPDKARAGYRRVFAEGSVVDYPLTIRARDGHLTHVLYNASVYRDIDGKVAGVFAAARDVTAQRRASQYARSLLEASLDPLVTINAEGRITDVNEATIKVTGCDRTSLIGTNFSQYFTEPDKAQAGYQRVFAEGAVVDYPLTIRHRDGRLTPVLYNASLFRDTDGKVAGVFAAARDVTAQRRAEAAIRELNRTLEQRVTERTAELEASNKELEAFTYSVSHDLRAPLRAMAGFANLLNQKQAPTLTDEGQQYLRRIDANATKMGALIDELLKFSRLGRSAMQIGRVDMTAAATAAFSELRDQAEAGGVEVTVSPLRAAQGDAALMHQVFANLIGNAIKFSRGRPGAKVEIGSHVDKGETVYDVRDNGVGFDMRYADKLFGVFQRLHSQAEYEGTGVGLALVQRIIHRHGGRVWAEAEVDKGAAFHFTLKGD